MDAQETDVIGKEKSCGKGNCGKFKPAYEKEGQVASFWQCVWGVF